MKDLLRLFGLLKPYWGRLLVATLCSVLYAGFRFKIASLIKPIIDVELNPLAEPSQSTESLPISLVIVLAFLGSGVFGYLSQYLMNFVGQNAVADLRNRLFEKIEFQSIGFFSERSTGVLVSRMINDVERIQLALSEKVCDLLKESFTAVFFAGLLLYIDPFLAVISLAAAPLVLLPIIKLGKRLRQVSHRSQERMGKMTSILHEAITGIRVVKAFSMEKFKLNKFRTETGKLVRTNLKAVRLVAILPPVMELLGGVAIGLIIVYGNLMIRRGELTPGEFATFLAVLFMLYTPIKKLARVNADVQQALAASQRVFRLIDLPGEMEHGKEGADLETVQGAIRFERICFSYEKEQVLFDIDLTIPAGSVVALVGSSGAGKSTLLSLLPRFYEPSKGRILVDGTDISKVTLDSLRKQIGLVSQDVILFNDTVRNNLTCGRDNVDTQALEQAARAANAHDFILELPEKYETVVGEKGVKLSEGQRQRIAMARALVKNPPILILDEATSSLDAESEMLVQEALSRLMTGRTVLVIAHRFSTIRNADRIVVIEQGRIVESGAHAELMNMKGYYYRYCTLQNEESIINPRGETC